MTSALLDLAAALEGVALAMDAETEAVRSGVREDFAARAEEKRARIEAATALMQHAEAAVPGPTERARLEHAARRLEAASGRNAEALDRVLVAMRRVLACVAEAAKAASTTGTYGPDGRAQPAPEAVATIERSA